MTTINIYHGGGGGKDDTVMRFRGNAGVLREILEFAGKLKKNT